MSKIYTVLVILLCALLAGCGPKVNCVVVYTSLDQVFSEPILKDFEQKTGIVVKAVYDVEAAKTTGLVNRLIAEQNNPQADVFWNSEIGRTIILKKKGILTPYVSGSAKNIPSQFKDKDGYWAGFGARARVLVYNTKLVTREELPKSIFELTEPKWKAQVALANPLFGTTAAHAAALFIQLGDDMAQMYFDGLKANDVLIVDGNSTARDRVADGIVKIAFTDTDDVNVAMMEGKPVDMIFPDKEGIGTLVIPNTVCMINGCPNPRNAGRFIDYLLSEEVESMLAHSGSLQIPLRDHVDRPGNTPSVNGFKAMDVDYEAISRKMESSGRILQDTLLR